MSIYGGDFIGFQLGDIHSTSLNIMRVSNSNRYSENLTPDINSTKVQVPGGDGTYYWNTFYTQKPITIDFAFDDLRDEDIRQLKQVLSFKGVQKLIFDETPYKYYMVRCSAPPTLKYIPFDLKGITVYKGEGAANLVAYYPFGISVNPVTVKSSSHSRILNPGDLPTGLKIYYSIEGAQSLLKIQLLKEDETSIGELNFSSISSLGENDEYICIDMKNHLIEGLDENFKKTGNLYNKFITTGDFFELPIGVYYIDSNVEFEKVEFSSLYY